MIITSISSEDKFFLCYSNIGTRQKVCHPSKEQTQRKKEERKTRGRKAWVCHCRAEFDRERDLNTHQKIHRRRPLPPQQPPPFCLRCKKGFLWRKNLNRHINTVHKEEDDLPLCDLLLCDHCNRTFIKRKDN